MKKRKVFCFLNGQCVFTYREVINKLILLQNIICDSLVSEDTEHLGPQQGHSACLGLSGVTSLRGTKG